MRLRDLLLALFAAFFMAVGSLSAQEKPRQLMFVHYMPWYASKEVSGHWGWHWTMNRFNPEKIDAAGRREIASHDEPLIGPYDSSDPFLIEYHLALMKLAGIDGVIIDWYGTSETHDYREIHRNTIVFINLVKQAGLKFAICYEDQSAGQLAETKRLSKAEAVAAGRRDLQWLHERCFRDDAYLRLADRPALLVFGPRYFSKIDWEVIHAGLPEAPHMFGLPHRVEEAGFAGTFGWPPVAGGAEIKPETWRAYLAELHARKTFIATAFPGFRDIYREAGVHESYGSIDRREGATLRETLAAARESGSPLVQIATWNDFGEGTMIEPTKIEGYRSLETVQRFTARSDTVTVDDLRLPAHLFELRRRFKHDAAKMETLRSASRKLLEGKCEEVRGMLESVEKNAGER